MTNDSITVRPAIAEDVPAIAAAWIDGGRLYEKLNAELFQVPAEEGLEDRFGERAEGRPEEESLFVAELDDQVVGWVHTLIEQPMDTAATQLQREFAWVRAHVNALMVAEGSRGQGIGTRLMAEAEAWARSRGARIVSLDAFVDSEAVAFYDKLGYSRRSIGFNKILE